VPQVSVSQWYLVPTIAVDSSLGSYSVGLLLISDVHNICVIPQFHAFVTLADNIIVD
jgi:hypothetical protein